MGNQASCQPMPRSLNHLVSWFGAYTRFCLVVNANGADLYLAEPLTLLPCWCSDVCPCCPQKVSHLYVRSIRQANVLVFIDGQRHEGSMFWNQAPLCCETVCAAGAGWFGKLLRFASDGVLLVSFLNGINPNP